MDDMSQNLNFALRREKIRSHQNLVISNIDHSDMNIICSSSIAKSLNNLVSRRPQERERSNTLTEDNPSVVALEEPSPLRPYPDFFKERPPLENGMNYLFEREGQTGLSEPRSEMRVNTGRWSAEEHQKFVEAMFLYGNEWKRVQQHIKTRSSTQARSHAQKFFIRLRKRFFEDTEEEDGRPVTRNERVFNWIKENVNWETIHKVARISGPNRETFSSDPLGSNEHFLNDRKDKLCKIILNLLSNSSKSKKKAFSKDSDDCESHQSVPMGDSARPTNNLPFYNNFASLPNSGMMPTCNTTPIINYSNILTEGRRLEEAAGSSLVPNYYNPNTNSYISIVTINLGCGKGEGDKEAANIIKNVNKDVNNNLNGMEPIKMGCSRADCKEDHFKDYINRRMPTKFVKTKTVMGNNIVSTGNFNIVNGNFNSVSCEKDPEKEKEKEVEKDPFKLTFEENINLTPAHCENDFCTINFNLDLDHFFNN